MDADFILLFKTLCRPSAIPHLIPLLRSTVRGENEHNNPVDSNKYLRFNKQQFKQ